MPRTLTPARRRQLAAARDKATKARQKADDRSLRVWQDWLKREARAYAEVVSARNAYGSNSSEASSAYKAWRKVKTSEPTRPSDGAFKRARGETDSNSNITVSEA